MFSPDPATKHPAPPASSEAIANEDPEHQARGSVPAKKALLPARAPVLRQEMEQTQALLSFSRPQTRTAKQPGSTAAWACIEFLLYDVIYLQYQGFASLFRQDSKKLRQKPISIWQKRKNSTQNNSAWDTPSQPKYSHAENLRIIKHIQEDDWDD